MSSVVLPTILRKTLGLSEMPAFAQEVLKKFQSRQILLLEGPVGVGKTEFVRALVIASGGLNEATSPSFAMHNHYEFDPVGAGVMHTIDHLDLYRIDGDDELESTGFWDLFSQKQGVVLIEWAERLPKDQLPRTWMQLTLTIKFASQPGQREFILSK